MKKSIIILPEDKDSLAQASPYLNVWTVGVSNVGDEPMVADYSLDKEVKE